MRIAFATLLALWASLPAQACEGLEVSAGWVRLAPPTARVMAGYLTLTNTGKTALVVDGARSEGFERVELHSMTHVDGVMRMRRLERIEIAPGKSVPLEPGGNHLMLIGPKRTFAIDEEVAVELLCGEQALPLRLPVREG
ncbi:MAG: copper chaperone PCu(A)C [Xanthomonadales bacterium]|nr:hypothetical protein [Xanthomonadales bacterium]MCC6592576.1 copper chaperone PCu(A)C [Xanthomonadales bacterium]